MKQSHFIRLGALVALMGMSGCGVEPLPESASIPESQQVVAGTEDTHQETPAETPDMIDGMAFVDGYAEGFRIAQEEGKPMLLFFTAEWCRYCHLMLEDAFVQEEVVSLSKRFVCVWVDADRETEVCETFEVDGYPTVQFLSPRGTVLNRVVGKRGAAEFLPEMQAALQAVAQHADDNDPVRRQRPKKPVLLGTRSPRQLALISGRPRWSRLDARALGVPLRARDASIRTPARAVVLLVKLVESAIGVNARAMTFDGRRTTRGYAIMHRRRSGKSIEERRESCSLDRTKTTLYS